MVTELNEQGLKKEATEIEIWLKTVMPSMPPSDEPLLSSKRALLPTRCPSCGAPLQQDEVEWLDEVTAECGYCGSPVREKS